MNQKQINHVYPVFHIKKWKQNDGYVYDKTKQEKHKINEKKLFSFKKYYSLGKNNQQLEDRLSVFESVIAPIIKKIDESTDNVVLTNKELELVKLYLVLCGSRHSFTSEVINFDESGIYSSNNYIFGLHRAQTKKEAVNITNLIVTDFERINNTCNEDLSNITSEIEIALSSYTIGLHLVILRASKDMICISDKICVIENTMDSDFLYVYVPMSPKTALLLVKSKYYYSEQDYHYTRGRFGLKYGNGMPDPYLSEIFGYYVDEENELFSSTSTLDSLTKSIEIRKTSDFVIRCFNSILCEDGTKILYCDEEELNWALNNKLGIRKITVG